MSACLVCSLVLHYVYVCVCVCMSENIQKRNNRKHKDFYLVFGEDRFLEVQRKF